MTMAIICAHPLLKSHLKTYGDKINVSNSDIVWVILLNYGRRSEGKGCEEKGKSAERLISVEKKSGSSLPPMITFEKSDS